MSCECSQERNPTTRSPEEGFTELLIEGMTCGNCARLVSEALAGVAGVAAADVQLDQVCPGHRAHLVMWWR
jgi:TPP-dependent pyruvate/acetoin dehydrogenase alpha subunit